MRKFSILVDPITVNPYLHVYDGSVAKKFPIILDGKRPPQSSTLINGVLTQNNMPLLTEEEIAMLEPNRKLI